MSNIYWGLQSRLDSIKKRAEGYKKHNPAGAYKSALEWQVKYGRKGWIKYDSANDYDDKGNLRLYNLNDYDAVPIQDISRRAFDYSGYYADSFQHELIKPYIIKIKSAMGLYIAPAIAYSESDIAIIYLSRAELVEKWESENVRESTIFRMASAADSIAEREAEINREADAKFQAEEQINDKKAENKEIRKEAHGLILAIKEQRRYSNILAPICQLLTDKLRELRRDIQRNNARIAALNDNYWLAVE